MKFLVVDDHAIIRTGLKLVISDFFAHSVIDEAPNGNTAFEKIKSTDYDIVILDVNLPHTDSFGLVNHLLTVKPDLRILMFSMNPEDNYAKRYLKLGAKGYLRKDESEDEIKRAISTVLNNKRYLSESLSLKIEEEVFGDKITNNPFEKLSPREFEIIQYIVRGESVGQISEKLHLHTSTIGTHKARIFEKLKCKNVIAINMLAKAYNVISA